MQLSEDTRRQCVFAKTGGKLAGISDIFHDKINQTLGYSTPAWLDDLIVVTRGSNQDHEKERFDLLNKLEKAGYRASKKLFMCQTKGLGHEIDKNELKPKEEKVEAILKLDPPKNPKEI